MLISRDGHRVKLLHHVHLDRRSPENTKGTNDLWALLGTDDFPQVVKFDQSSLGRKVQAPRPAWEAMRDAPNAAAFKALASNAIVWLLPSLAYHLLSADSNGPAKLGTTLASNMNTANRHDRPLCTPIYGACALFWLASQPNFAASVLLQPLSSRRALTWSKIVRVRNIQAAPLCPKCIPNVWRRVQTVLSNPVFNLLSLLSIFDMVYDIWLMVGFLMTRGSVRDVPHSSLCLPTGALSYCSQCSGPI
jgi:hypothetical protein